MDPSVRLAIEKIDDPQWAGQPAFARTFAEI
jgi:hypothetical protein